MSMSELCNRGSSSKTKVWPLMKATLFSPDLPLTKMILISYFETYISFSFYAESI